VQGSTADSEGVGSSLDSGAGSVKLGSDEGSGAAEVVGSEEGDGSGSGLASGVGLDSVVGLGAGLGDSVVVSVLGSVTGSSANAVGPVRVMRTASTTDVAIGLRILRERWR
jgi:hypothetical protein